MVELQRWVIHGRGGRSHAIVDVRFAPKATVELQNAICRFVPLAAIAMRTLSQY